MDQPPPPPGADFPPAAPQIPVPPSASVPPAYSTGPEAMAQPPKKRHVWPWIVGGCGCLLLLLLIIGGVAAAFYFGVAPQTRTVSLPTPSSQPSATAPPAQSPAYTPWSTHRSSPSPSAAPQRSAPQERTAPEEEQTVEFPRNKPAFSVTAPPGWKGGFTEGGYLQLTWSNSDDIWILFVEAANVHSQIEARRFLPNAADASIKALHYTNMRPARRVFDIQSKNISGVANEYHGQNEKGVPMICQYLVFTPGGSRYFTMVVVSTVDANSATVQDQAAITNSIVAVR